jgi:hypothetical protein
MIYRIGASVVRVNPNKSTTNADVIFKNITPLGGFSYYCVVKNYFDMVKGGIVEIRKRPIILGKKNFPQTCNAAT